MIVGISAKKDHGKDTACSIMQYLFEYPNSLNRTDGRNKSYNSYIMDVGMGHIPILENKKFAHQVKEITCMILGCTREQLEDPIFKEIPLGDEWHCMVLMSNMGVSADTPKVITHEHFKTLGFWEQMNYRHRAMTPRLFMQLLGTDFGREMIHPSIWVNSLMKHYVQQKDRTCFDCKHSFNFKEAFYPIQTEKKFFLCPKCKSMRHAAVLIENTSKWAITDVRFHNEVDIIHKKGGIVLRVFNPRIPKPENEHYSETALDDYEFAHYLTNDGTIEDMIEPIRDFLKFNELI